MTEAEIEKKAREHYEDRRRYVTGRPKWEHLDPNDAYDMGMRKAALEVARKILEASTPPAPDARFRPPGHFGDEFDREPQP